MKNTCLGPDDSHCVKIHETQLFNRTVISLFELFIFSWLNHIYFFLGMNFKKSMRGRVRNHPVDYFSPPWLQSEVEQEDWLNNSGQAINSDSFCDPTVLI